MSFKPDFPVDRPVALSGFGVLSVQGADAAAFLQAQTMNDVLALASGSWHWNGWLTPKGRVVALFALLRVAPERFLLVLPDHPAEPLRLALQRFVFRSKVALAVPDLVVAAGPAHPAAAAAGIAGDEDDGLAIDAGGDGIARTLWLLPAGHPTLAGADPGVDAAWRAGDIAQGLPRLGPAQQEAWTPQQLSLDRLQAYSLRKGCYPGQEIVARTHYLGQAKRSLVRLSGDGIAEGQAVHAGERVAGIVICVTRRGDEALAVLAVDTTEPLEVGGTRVTITPLNGGLAR